MKRGVQCRLWSSHPLERVPRCRPFPTDRTRSEKQRLIYLPTRPLTTLAKTYGRTFPSTSGHTPLSRYTRPPVRSVPQWRSYLAGSEGPGCGSNGMAHVRSDPGRLFSGSGISGRSVPLLTGSTKCSSNIHLLDLPRWTEGDQGLGTTVETHLFHDVTVGAKGVRLPITESRQLVFFPLVSLMSVFS